MSVPGIVRSTLDGEEIAAQVSLGSEDELFITSSSTFLYRSDGLLRDESVDEFPHDAERLTLSEGRRKTKFTLEYPLEGTREFTIPAGKTDAVLHPVLAGVLNGNGITNPGETVVKTYRFSELTLIITSERLVKHLGSAVWDEDFAEYHFSDVTNLSFEDGSVATQIVLVVDGRPQRIKAPNEEANDLRERLQRALFEYHDVDSLAALNEAIGEDEADEPADSPSAMDFGSGVDPLDANPPEPDDHDDGPAAIEDGTATASEGAGESAIPESIDARRERADDRGEEHAQSGQQAQAQSQPQTQTESQSTQPGSPDETDDEPESESSVTTETADLFDEHTGSGTGTKTGTGTNESASEAESSAEPAVTQSMTDRSTDGDGATTAGRDADPAGDADSQPTAAPEVLDRLETLEDAVDRQSELIERQQETIEQLIAELRQGR